MVLVFKIPLDFCKVWVSHDLMQSCEEIQVQLIAIVCARAKPISTAYKSPSGVSVFLICVFFLKPVIKICVYYLFIVIINNNSLQCTYPNFFFLLFFIVVIIKDASLPPVVITAIKIMINIHTLPFQFRGAIYKSYLNGKTISWLKTAYRFLNNSWEITQKPP